MENRQDYLAKQRHGPPTAAGVWLMLLLAAMLWGCTDENEAWDVGHPCEEDWECKTDICHNGLCWCRDDCKLKGDTCTKDAECLSGKCTSGLCKANGGHGVGDPCINSAECSSKNCSSATKKCVNPQDAGPGKDGTPTPTDGTLCDGCKAPDMGSDGPGCDGCKPTDLGPDGPGCDGCKPGDQGPDGPGCDGCKPPEFGLDAGCDACKPTDGPLCDSCKPTDGPGCDGCKSSEFGTDGPIKPTDGPLCDGCTPKLTFKIRGKITMGQTISGKAMVSIPGNYRIVGEFTHFVPAPSNSSKGGNFRIRGAVY